MPLRSPGHRCLRGLTLVELLVVIGILSILVGILLGALGTARRRADEPGCISNLRQTGSAIRQYMDDHELRPPSPHLLHPKYVSDKRLFLCSRDTWTDEGGWAWLREGCLATPPEHWPIAISYLYPWPRETGQDRDPSLEWLRAQSAPGRPGYLACVLHGQPIPGTGLHRPPVFEGRVLRLCFDGSVVVVDVRYRAPGLFAPLTAVTGLEH